MFPPFGRLGGVCRNGRAVRDGILRKVWTYDSSGVYLTGHSMANVQT